MDESLRGMFGAKVRMRAFGDLTIQILRVSNDDVLDTLPRHVYIAAPVGIGIILSTGIALMLMLWFLILNSYRSQYLWKEERDYIGN
jgi:hypothetical protein